MSEEKTKEAINEMLLFKESPPQVTFFSLEAQILTAAYNMVENVKKIRYASNKEEIQRRAQSVDHAIERLRAYLSIVKADLKQISTAEALSRETNLQSGGNHQEWIDFKAKSDQQA
jgi:hypothetical protein